MSIQKLMSRLNINTSKRPVGRGNGRNPATAGELIALHSQAKYLTLDKLRIPEMQPNGTTMVRIVQPTAEQGRASAVLQMVRAYG